MSVASCNNTDNGNNANGEIKVDNYSVSVDDTSLNGWHCYDINLDRICCPKSWEEISQNECLFYSQIGDTNVSTYFAVVRNKDITYDKYFKELYSVLKNDKVELLREYKFTKINFSQKTTYYGEFITLIDKVSYVTFTSFIEVNGITYDISLKVLLNDKDRYYKQYQSILHNYKTSQQYLYTIQDKPKSIEEIDLSSY